MPTGVAPDSSGTTSIPFRDPIVNKTATSNTLLIKAQDASCFVEPYDPPPIPTPAFPPFNEAKASIFRYRQQQGVNLGSWFVHEQWMTPSLFTCASGKKLSELDIASGWVSTTSARNLLERHWDTFITAEDFEYLASIGINTVRLPIGYWNLGPLYCQNTPFEPVADVYQNSWARIVRTINMAASVSIGVLIDLHGAVGSQNGQPHSGISDGQTNLFTNSAYQTQTIAVLTFLTQQLALVNNVVGIQLLNEPLNVPQLTDFYTRALTTVRATSPQAATFPFYVHDGFDLQRFNQYISARQDFVVQDHHSYFVFTPKDDAESPASHIQDITGSIGQSLATASQSQRNNLVVAEWSCALTPQSLAQAQDPEAAQKRFCEGQMEVYQNTTAGWSFWSYKKEGCSSDEGWCFKNAVGKTLPSTFFAYTGPTASATVPSPAVLSTLLNMHLPDITTILDRAAEEDSFPAAFAPEAEGGRSDISPSIRFGNKLSSTGSVTSHQRRHRFMAVHSRRQLFPSFGNSLSLSTTQQAVIKGYSDGFNTAKIFATFGLSKLGFEGQYIADSWKALGGAMDEGQQDIYREWFGKGLVDGVTQVRSIVLVS
ncbi:glycoside hydrolase family 5 protein [Ramaria rubella]|nr:glycoside hydrolase family 5 protein [Ramaria rubella]